MNQEKMTDMVWQIGVKFDRYVGPPTEKGRGKAMKGLNTVSSSLN